ncbi:carbohydrate ABC transporter permease [Paenibacillus sp. HB172176]|uniref:carbohydrate ABC transporter permease n=1 Tax=Paenibacillus sp. HB172176 TaxID=2493690 RepID=UPI00143AA3DD|nr:carbohydrate ABC transporter permease [Paenibacillus sp. HB172176]
MRDNSIGSRIFSIVNVAVLAAIAFICVFPFIEIVGGSFASNQELIARDIVIIPHQFSLDAYRYIFSSDKIPHSLLITVFITVTGTMINLALTASGAFALARPGMKGRGVILFLIVFTMLFQGGLIPTYLVVKELHLLNTLWAVMLPGAISAFNLILMRNFFMQLPEEIYDSAKIDGCNDLVTFVRIALPLSKASLATFTLFYAVTHWNSFLMPFLYLNNSDLWPIQIWLRDMIVLASGDFQDPGFSIEVATRSLQSATIVVATLPILLFYPFVQKYFAQGVTLGSVKG